MAVFLFGRLLSSFTGRFIAYPSTHAHVAHVLWIAHTHLMDAWESTPRIAFLSPEPASGKTRAVEITELLVPNPVEAVNVTPAYLFRKVGSEDGSPTVLYDEIDTVFGPKAKDNEEIRGLLNAGHRRGAVAGRCVVKGKTVETEEIPAYCAVALAGLGWLPDTLLSRCVIIRMQRRKPAEKIEAYRRRVHADEGHKLENQLATWAAASLPSVTNVWPDMPIGVEIGTPTYGNALLAIADAGWRGLARPCPSGGYVARGGCQGGRAQPGDSPAGGPPGPCSGMLRRWPPPPSWRHCAPCRNRPGMTCEASRSMTGDWPSAFGIWGQVQDRPRRSQHDRLRRANARADLWDAWEPTSRLSPPERQKRHKRHKRYKP